MSSTTLVAKLFDLLLAAQAERSGWRAFISGAHLATQLSVTRGAVWKAVAQLRTLGLNIEALPRQGYRLTAPCTALSSDAIDGALLPALRARLREGRCEWQLASTNAVLLARGNLQLGQFDYLTAEIQTEGRGRRGRQWLAPPGGAVCLSWSWCFDSLPPQGGALGLVIGVTALRALRSLSIEGVQIKWPNDLVSAHGKLGGILVELRSEAGGPVHLVCGIGLNLRLPASVIDAVAVSGNKATDLAALSDTLPDRSAVVAALLQHGLAGLQELQQTGLASFRDDFEAADALFDLPIIAQGATDSIHGTARGIDADGALLISTASGLQRVLSADVSVRPATPSPAEAL
jgi:BirA family biotin operon repressor/biotin-[acetyl-CoA-carboxylase] ligase